MAPGTARPDDERCLGLMGGDKSEDRQGMGIKEGDIVTVSSPSGAIDLPVYLYPAVRPDTVSIPIGQGHTALADMPKAEAPARSIFFHLEKSPGPGR